jgi:predicted MFS family arabinose efflux permease
VPRVDQFQPGHDGRAGTTASVGAVRGTNYVRWPSGCCSSDRALLTSVQPAIRSTYAAFIGAGFAFASWASRIPQVKAHLELTPADLGLVLLAIAAGSIVSLPLSGIVVHYLGTRRTVAGMASLFAAALAITALGYLVGVGLLVVGLFVLGFANGAWDVAMNVQAAAVERHLGRSIMSRFHAGFSLGTVGGALVGAVMIALHISVTTHLLAVALVVAVAVPLSVRSFLPDSADSEPQRAGRASALSRWREPRTLLIGIFVLAFAFAEGTGNDWINVALIDGHDASPVVATLGFAVFLSAMTITRWVGPSLLDRYGRVVVVRAIAIVAVVGLILFVYGPNTTIAFIGALLWGTGASLGFPVGMSAAADDSTAAPARVSVVASIGYCAFLGGPPLIGFLGSRVGVLHALTVVAAVLVIATVVAGALRPVNTEKRTQSVD